MDDSYTTNHNYISFSESVMSNLDEKTIQALEYVVDNLKQKRRPVPLRIEPDHVKEQNLTDFQEGYNSACDACSKLMKALLADVQDCLDAIEETKIQ